jgi:hypothetical protein
LVRGEAASKLVTASSIFLGTATGVLVFVKRPPQRRSRPPPHPWNATVSTASHRRRTKAAA